MNACSPTASSSEAHGDGAERGRRGQPDEQLVEQRRGRVALDDHGAVVLDGRAGLDLLDEHTGRVVVAHDDLDVAHERAVEARVGRDDAVVDGDDARALRARIVDRQHVDALVGVPVGAAERQHQGALRDPGQRVAVVVDVALELRRVVAVGVGGAGAQPDRVAARLLLRRAAGRDGDVHRAGRRGRQPDVVAVDAQAVVALAHGREAAGLGDDHVAAGRRRDVDVDPLDEPPRRRAGRPR